MEGIRRVYVGGLRNEVKENDVEDVFRPFGVLTSVWVAKKPPGFGFVEFADAGNAQEAVDQLRNATIMGQPIKVELSDPKTSNKAKRLARNDNDRYSRIRSQRSRSHERIRIRDGDHGRDRERDRDYVREIRRDRDYLPVPSRSYVERVDVRHRDIESDRIIDRPRMEYDDPLYRRDAPSAKYVVERRRDLSPPPVRTYVERSPIHRSRSRSRSMRYRDYHDPPYETVRVRRDRMDPEPPLIQREVPENGHRVEVYREKRYY